MHHRPAALGHHEQGFYRGLPLLEILLGLGKLLDIVRGVLEGDDLATAEQGNGIVERPFPTLREFSPSHAVTASSPAASARLDRSGDISQPSNTADRAIPESR